MMRDWLAFLDSCEAEAVAGDPTLTDRETQGRAIYLRRNGEAALLRMLKSRARRKDGKMPWSVEPTIQGKDEHSGSTDDDA